MLEMQRLDELREVCDMPFKRVVGRVRRLAREAESHHVKRDHARVFAQPGNRVAEEKRPRRTAVHQQKTGAVARTFVDKTDGLALHLERVRLEWIGFVKPLWNRGTR